MKLAIIDSEIVCAEVGPYYEQLRDTGRFRWNRRDKTMRARMCLDSLEALSSCCKLPPHLASELLRLRELRDAVERQRTSENPVPLLRYPIKNAELMKHQVRGANMALLVFGAVQEENGGNT